MKSLASFALIMALSACSGAYLNSVTKYSEAASESASSLAEVPGTMGGLCHERAVARFLKTQLLAEAPAPAWRSYFDAPNEADGKHSWNQYCAAVVETSDGYATLIELLEAYASAMKALADEADWDGQPLNDLTANLAKLAGDDTPGGKSLAALASPAQSLGKLVVSSYTKRKTHEFAVEADKPVQTILSGLDSYLEAVKKDLVAPTAKERREVVDLLENKAAVWSQEKEAGRIISFVEFAQATEDAAAQANATIESAQKLLGKLKEGQSRLATAEPNSASAPEILAAATEILLMLNQLKAAQHPDS